MGFSFNGFVLVNCNNKSLEEKLTLYLQQSGFVAAASEVFNRKITLFRSNSGQILFDTGLAAVDMKYIKSYIKTVFKDTGIYGAYCSVYDSDDYLWILFKENSILTIVSNDQKIKLPKNRNNSEILDTVFIEQITEIDKKEHVFAEDKIDELLRLVRLPSLKDAISFTDPLEVSCRPSIDLRFIIATNHPKFERASTRSYFEAGNKICNFLSDGQIDFPFAFVNYGSKIEGIIINVKFHNFNFNSRSIAYFAVNYVNVLKIRAINNSPQEIYLPDLILEPFLVNLWKKEIKCPPGLEDILNQEFEKTYFRFEIKIKNCTIPIGKIELKIFEQNGNTLMENTYDYSIEEGM
jgi:hypothetical protein